jgi:hypothetical protein
MCAIGPIVSTSVERYRGNRRSHGCDPYQFSPMDLLLSRRDVGSSDIFHKSTILIYSNEFSWNSEACTDF